MVTAIPNLNFNKRQNQPQNFSNQISFRANINCTIYDMLRSISNRNGLVKDGFDILERPGVEKTLESIDTNTQQSIEDIKNCIERLNKKAGKIPYTDGVTLNIYFDREDSTLAIVKGLIKSIIKGEKPDFALTKNPSSNIFSGDENLKNNLLFWLYKRKGFLFDLKNEENIDKLAKEYLYSPFEIDPHYIGISAIKADYKIPIGEAVKKEHNLKQDYLEINSDTDNIEVGLSFNKDVLIKNLEDMINPMLDKMKIWAERIHNLQIEADK